MKKLFLLLFFIPVLAIGQDISKLDEKYGFRDVAFESDISSLTGFEKWKIDKTGQTYYRKSDALELGDAKLKSIYYGFQQGKLAYVLLTSSGPLNGVKLSQFVEANYGPGTVDFERSVAKTNTEKTTWKSEKILITLLNPAPYSPDYILSIESLPMKQIIQKGKADAAGKVKNGF